MFKLPSLPQDWYCKDIQNIQSHFSPKEPEQSNRPVRAALQREHVKQAKTSHETHKQQEVKQRAQLQLSISPAGEAASPLAGRAQQWTEHMEKKCVM